MILNFGHYFLIFGQNSINSGQNLFEELKDYVFFFIPLWPNID